MTAQIIAFPLSKVAAGRSLREAYPIENAPADMLDLWEACLDALDSGCKDQAKLQVVSDLLDKIA